MADFYPAGKTYEVNVVDQEKQTASDSGYEVNNDGAVAAETFLVGDSFFARAQRFAAKFGVEARGIERVPENERSDTTLHQIGTMVCFTPHMRA